MNPVAHVKVNGVSSEELDRRIKGVRFTDNAGTANDTMEIDLEDVDRSAMIPEDGDKIDLYLGYEPKNGHINPEDSEPKHLGTFVLDEVKWGGPPDVLTLVGHGFDTGDAFKAQWTESYHQMLLGDIVTKVAERNSLQPRIHAELGSILIPHIDQKAISDMAFLASLAEGVTAEMKACDGQLYFAPFGRLSEVGLTLGPTDFDMPEDMLGTYSYTRQSRAQYAQVRVRIHNTDEQDVGSNEADAEPEEAEPDAIMELPAGTPSPIIAGLQTKSRATKLKHSRHKLTFTSVGHPNLRAETKVTVVGLRDGLPDKWLIVQATHEFHDSGYTTNCECITSEQQT